MQTQAHIRRGRRTAAGALHLSPAADATTKTTKSKTALYSTGSTSSSSSATNIGQILGGDYAGLSATFSSIDGKLIPVPEHYVPKSMIEWGQVPNYLEVIVSEDLNTNYSVTGTGTGTGTITDIDNMNDNSHNHTVTVFERNTVTVMPEVGCGLDNLDTIKTKEVVPLDSYHYHICPFDDSDCDDINIKVATMFVTKGKRRIECMFVHDYDDNEQRQRQRTRVCINLQDSGQMKSPIQIIREQMTSEKSSRGTIADGGGLDARTVTQLVGRENISKPFCQEKVSGNESLDGGGWRKVVCEDGERLLFVIGAGDDGVTTLNLPSGVQVRHCASPSRMIEVSLLESDEDGVPVRGIAVLHNIDIDGDGDGDGDSSTTPTVRCYNNGETKTRK